MNNFVKLQATETWQSIIDVTVLWSCKFSVNITLQLSFLTLQVIMSIHHHHLNLILFRISRTPAPHPGCLTGPGRISPGRNGRRPRSLPGCCPWARLTAHTPSHFLCRDQSHVLNTAVASQQPGTVTCLRRADVSCTILAILLRGPTIFPSSVTELSKYWKILEPFHQTKHF